LKVFRQLITRIRSFAYTRTPQCGQAAFDACPSSSFFPELPFFDCGQAFFNHFIGNSVWRKFTLARKCL